MLIQDSCLGGANLTLTSSQRIMLSNSCTTLETKNVVEGRTDPKGLSVVQCAMCTYAVYCKWTPVHKLPLPTYDIKFLQISGVIRPVDRGPFPSISS